MTGPYVVTVKRLGRVVDPFKSYGSFERDSIPRTVVVSRVAVATLEEAREVAFEWLHTGASPTRSMSLARKSWATDLGESGGSVSLPDGSVVEVRQGPAQNVMRSDLRTWGAPIDTLRSDDAHTTAAWVAAINARERGANVRQPVIAALNALDEADWNSKHGVTG